MAQPTIGQRAKLNGKPVVWSGENYGWQSPTTHNKLKEDGKFKVGTQAIDRLVSGVGNSQPVKAIQGFQQSFRRITDRLGFDKVENAVNTALRSDDKLPSSRVAQGGAIAARSITDRLGLDPRLAMVGMVAAGANPYRKTPAEVQRALQRQGPGGSLRLAFADARRVPNVATDDWAALGHRLKDGQVKDTGSFIKLSPEEKIRARQGTHPNSPPEFRGRVYVTEGSDPSIRSQDAVNPKHRYNADSGSVEEIPSKNRVTQYGKPKYKPPSPNPGGRPSSTSGPASPRRVHVEGQPGPKRLEKGFNVRPEDMSPPRGDGNNYGPFAKSNEVPGYVDSGGFIVRGDQRHRQARDAQRQGFLEQQRSAKGKVLNQDNIREEVAWADGDVDKLNSILSRLGGTPQRYASDATKAINRRLGAIEQRRGGQTALTKDETRRLTEGWDWKNLTGQTKGEAERLSRLASKLFGSGRPGRRPITQQPAGGFRGGNIPEEIKRRLDSLNETITRGGRAPSRSTRSANSAEIKRTERADRLVESRDQRITESASKPPYKPKLTSGEREAARRARAGRPLRPASQRTRGR